MNESDPSGMSPASWICAIIGSEACAIGAAGGVFLGGSNIIPTGLNMDANVLIDAFHGPYKSLLNGMINVGNAPVVSPMALSEYHHNRTPIMNYLVANNGWVSPDVNSAQVVELQQVARDMGRVLHNKDARILSSALQDGEQNGVNDVVLTGDKNFYKFMKQAGFPAKWWPANGPAPDTSASGNCA